jgi:predicted nucleic acid-binding protein
MPETFVLDCSVAAKWVLREPNRAPRLFDMRPHRSRALDLSLRYQMSLWDCVYVAHAIEHQCPLLTADRRLVQAGGVRHPSLRLVQ